MPTYNYKAINDKTGRVVKNKVEEGNKAILMKKLKANGLSPISIRQTIARKSTATKKKRNISNIEQIIGTSKSTNLNAKENNMSKIDAVKSYFAMQKKITERDLVIFTQNFYLLKKANFNNVHALTTIIQSTENRAFVGVLEDILAGVEARRLYV